MRFAALCQDTLNVSKAAAADEGLGGPGAARRGARGRQEERGAAAQRHGDGDAFRSPEEKKKIFGMSTPNTRGIRTATIGNIEDRSPCLS